MAGLNNKENREHFTKSKKKINIISNNKSSDKCFKEPEKKVKGKELELNQVKAKVRVAQEIKVFRLISLHKKVTKVVKKLLQSKANLKVKNVLAKKIKISHKDNLVKNRQAKKDRTKIWERHI